MCPLMVIMFMAIASRMSGGGLGAPALEKIKLQFVPEVFFAAGFGWAAFQYGGWLAALVSSAWSYIWMQTGHGTVLHWGTHPEHATGERTQTLTPVVNWLAKRLGLAIGEVGYCRLFMAVKGFLIGLPVGGLPLAVLWPIGYETGARLRGRVPFDSHTVSELAAGAGAGLAICLVI